MAGGCCNHCPTEAPEKESTWRRVLWMSLILNATMFIIEVTAGVTSHSASLKADALDFLGDSANYAISLGVTGLALKWRARAALLKGTSLLLLGSWVLISTVWMALNHTVPHAKTMGVIAGLALVVNLICAVLLWRHRGGDSNRRSVWICSRNDAIGNIAVAAAALGVFGTGTAWPDIGVAATLAALGISGGWQIIRHARTELRAPVPPIQTPAASSHH